MSDDHDRDDHETTTRHGQLFPPRPEDLPESALESAGGAVEYAALLESQCGATDDSQPVELYDGALGVTTAFVATNQPMVGQLQWNSNLGTIYVNPGNVNGARWATGTLIADNLFLTAGHNFDQTGGGWTRPKDNASGTTIPPSEIATNMHVNFNYQHDPGGNLRPEQEFPVVELVEYRLNGLDYAIVRLGGNPNATFGAAQISTTDAAVGATACIIGHPAGVPKRVEAGPVFDLHGDQIGYNDIDTLGGNSGSGILLGSNGHIVGVHTNGGCSIASDPNGDAFHNHGVRISSILAASPTLQDLTAPRPTLKFLDDPRPTLKVTDDPRPTLKFVDDPRPTLKFTDDPIGTIKFVDDPRPTLKVTDDPRPSLKFTDDIGTIKALDDGTGSVKALDDVKLPALDKQFSDRKLPGSDVGQPSRPGVRGEQQGGGARPFVLSTPHHSMAWAGQGGQEGEGNIVSHYEEAIAELEELIRQGTEELEQLHQLYQQAVSEYQELMSGSGR